ncbi:hypothetical protein AXX12_18270 [Anaerosporomusa subterranea]|uniref:Oxidoreductase DRL-like catalytic domain-containing protein n=1 Tax=Anaerosporomusa subterranea TaxID=1794912 RepID=A0A154BUU7_ANASB|nr:hypothetical protein [Anaerosporomusa subterranea]KYZ77677.1 hypothetical protein AXX12_18270 [Anaerosporomusa subterranea]
MIYQHLYSRFSKKGHVTAAIIGSGHFGTAVITQSMHNPLLKVPVVCDQNVSRARDAYGKAGITDDMVVVCDSVSTAKAALEQGKYVIVADPMIVMELPIDVIGEATGIPEAGVRHALAAIQHGKHIAMINKEADSAVGPILQHLAEKSGLVYTPVDGDQHGLLIGMFYWAQTLGLNVICGGKARDAEFVLDRKKKTVTCEADGITIHETKVVQLKDEDLDLFDELPVGKEAEYMERRKALLAELPMAGGFDLCELTIMCNSTGLAPDVPATHEAIVRITEVPKVLCTKEDGGFLRKTGAIEVVTVFRDTFESGLGGGEFMVVASPNEYSQMILTTKGCLSNSKGTAALVHRPHHLCGVETSTSILCAGMVGITTGSSEYLPRYDLVRTAACDLKAGYKLGTDHDQNLKSAIVPANAISGKSPVPAHMANGNELLCDVSAGTMITFDMIKRPEDSVLWDLRQQQDQLFLQK